MADFCKQCSIDLFGVDNADLANLGGERKLEPGMYWPAICEGCGFILVDDDGNCCECDIKPDQPGHGTRNPHNKRPEKIKE